MIDRRSIRFLASLAFLFLAWAGAHPAAATEALDLRVLGTGGLEDRPTLKVATTRDAGVELQFELPTVAVQEVWVEGERFQSLVIPGGGSVGETGEPELPIYTRFLAIPDRAGLRLDITIEESEEYPDLCPLPVQPADGEAFAYDLAAYNRSGYGATPAAWTGEPAILGGVRVVPVVVSPVRFDPARRTVQVASRIRVDVSFEGEDSRNMRTLGDRPITTSMDRLLRDIVVNYPLVGGDREVVQGTWLAICPNDNNVLQALQPLVEWRQKKGYPVYVATTAETGSSNSSIKSWIQNAYDTWDAPPEFIVLVGDASSSSYIIPTWFETYSGYGGEGDHPYVQLEGNDILADAHIGRLSISNLTELQVVVAKTVGYESTPWIQNDPDWFHRGCLVGDPNSSGYSTVMVQQWIKTRLRQIGWVDANIDTIFGGNFVSQMSTALNRGDTIFCYRGYYNMSGWSNTNTYALSNGWKMPFAVISTCGTGSFAGGTARSEAFLRAGSTTNPKGAIGAIGTATLGTHTRFNNCYTYGVMEGLYYYRDFYEMGVAHTRGKYNLYLQYPTQQNWVAIFSYWNNLMGDPACEIWTGQPTPLQVTAPASLPVGANVVPVTVEADGAPLEGAQVSLWRSGQSPSVAKTGPDGSVLVPIDSAFEGQIHLTVTDHDYYPHLATLTVSTQPRFVGVESYLIDDNGIGESDGNNDGLINPTETIELRVRLKNFGTQTITGITAYLNSNDPFVTIHDGVEPYDDLTPGQASYSDDDFDFTVAPGTPDEHAIELELTVTSGSDEWTSLILLDTVSADLRYKTHNFTNAGGNGLLDPGETVGLVIDLDNLGGAGADAPTATLFSLSEFVSFPDGEASFPDIPAGSHASNASDPFLIKADPSCYPGYSAQMKMVVEFSGGRTDTVWLYVPVGTRAVTDPTGPDAYGYYAFDSGDTSYPEAPVYDWVEIDPNYGGNGIQVTLGDYGQYQDKTRTIGLPFPFTYYGETYDTVSICSNGWIVMGETYLTHYRNWYLPSPGGPNGAIAAFWDDLIEQSTGHVYVWNDAANHRWIVEWSRLKHRLNYSLTETFEIILYDPVHHPTDTGDGIIEFQYQTVDSYDGTDGYFTTGIESPDNTMGLTWAYFNQYASGAPNGLNGRAIRWVPKRETLAGVIEGTVRDEVTGNPLAAATVTVLETGNEFLSDPAGWYEGVELPGTYTLTAERVGFEPDTVRDVDVTPGNTSTVDFFLRDITPPTVQYGTPIPSTTDQDGPYPVQARISDASQLQEASVYYRLYEDDFQSLAMTPSGLNFYRASIPGQIWTTRVDYYIYVEDTSGNITTLPPGAPEEVYTFWVAPLLTAYDEDMETDTGWTVGTALDDATEGIWERVDPNGTWSGEEPVQPEDDHTPDPGLNCWVTGNADPGADQDANDVEGGRTTLVSPAYDLSEIDGVVVLRYWRWFTNDTGANPGEDEWVVRVTADGQTWTDLERTTESDRSWRRLEFILNDVIPLSDQVQFRFIATDGAGPSIVEAAVDDVELLYFGLTPADAGEPAPPVSFGLAEGLANPLRPGATLGFALERPGEARLTVFDVQGRAVRTLVSGALPAGRHAASWNGLDDAGHPISSGLYFIRLEAEGKRDTRKTLMIR